MAGLPADTSGIPTPLDLEPGQRVEIDQFILDRIIEGDPKGRQDVAQCLGRSAATGGPLLNMSPA